MTYQAYTGAPSTPVFRDVGLQDLTYMALSGRRLTEDTCRRFQYGIDGDGNQRATYHDRDGNPVAQKVRTKDKRFWVDGAADKMTLFGQRLWKSGGRRVVVTEGEVDAMTVSQVQDHKWPVVSIPQGAASAAKFFGQELEWLESFEEVVLMFDADEPGRKAAVECAQVLSPGKTRIAALPLKDASELLMAGRRAEITKAMWNAAVWKPEDLVFGDEVWESIANYEAPPSVDYPYPQLNALTHGLRFGEVVTICAGTGVGKSTFMRELASDIASKVKCAYIAIEETFQRSALGFLSVALSKPLHFGGYGEDTKAAMREAWAGLQENLILFDGWGSVPIDDLLAKVRYLTKGLGCKVVFLDHLSLIISGHETSDERKAIDLIMTKLASLAVETGAAIVLVCHLNSPGQGKTHEEGGRVRLTNLRGSRAIGQLSFDVIALERDQQSEDSTVATLRVLKCRWTGLTGVAGYLDYNRETGRLLEVAGPQDNEDFS